MHRAIVIDTLRDHLAERFGLLVWCPQCRHQTRMDLEALVTAGHGDRPLEPLRFRCSACGGLGKVLRQPPVPSFVPPGPRCEA